MSERWREDAECIGVGDVLFFADGPGESMADAKWLCGRCPVRQECLDFAISHSYMEFGVFGGMSPRERQRERARRNKERRTAA